MEINKNTIEVGLPNGGKIVAEASRDPAYPGIYLSYEGPCPEGVASLPTTLMEYTEGKGLRLLSWENEKTDEYSREVVFSIPGLN